MTLTINLDIQNLIMPLRDEEKAQLEANLVAEGCRDALVIWQEEGILLDGHHRYEICERRGLPYATMAISLPDMDTAKIWIIRNQRGRRNLTPEQQSYLRGTEYQLTRGRRGGDKKSKGNSYPLMDTASQLAAEHKVSAKTIKNDAAFTRAIDTLAAAVGGEGVDAARHALLARETNVDRQGVRILAQVATKHHPQTARHILEDMQAAPTPKAAKEVLRQAVKADRELFARYGTHDDDDAAPPALCTEMEAPVPTTPTENDLPSSTTECLDDRVSVALVVKALSRLAGILVAWDLSEPRTAEECLVYLRKMADAAANDLTGWNEDADGDEAEAEDSAPSSEGLPIPTSTGTIADRLVAALEAAPAGLTVTDLMQVLGAKIKDVQFACKRLIAQGLVRYNDTTKLYRLAEPKEA